MSKAQPDVRRLLGGYAAKRCARKAHNDHDPTLRPPPWEDSPEVVLRKQGGITYEAEVFAAIAATGVEHVLFGPEFHSAELIEATMAAAHSGVPVILGGQLPYDVAGGRTGKPDILLKVDDGYLPADVKHHKVTSPSKTKSLRASSLAAPTAIVEVPGLAPQLTARFGDYIQLAHYTRMLEAAGIHPGPDYRIGAIVGSDVVQSIDPSGMFLTWFDLNQPIFQTFSRSEGKKKRTALERYDHEHEFRRKVVEVARQQGEPGAPKPLVQPIWQAECLGCNWSPLCTEMLAGTPILKVGNLDVREWNALRNLGVESTEELAELDITDPEFLTAYEPEVAHRTGALKRLDAAVARAGMMRDGIASRRMTSGPLGVPAVDVEIDFDIEWDPATRWVYLWGFLVTRGGTSTYTAFTKWDHASAADDAALAAEAFAWLRQQVADAKGSGETVAVYHWSHPEKSMPSSIFGSGGIVDLEPYLVDVRKIVDAHFFTVKGHSVKVVAPLFGFSWRDDEAGGEQSTTWFLTAQGSGAEAQASRERLLAYNEDDCRSTLVVRQGLRSLEVTGETVILG